MLQPKEPDETRRDAVRAPLRERDHRRGYTNETKEGNELVLVASQPRRWRAHGLLNVYNSRSTHRTTRVCYIDEVTGLSFSRMHWAFEPPCHARLRRVFAVFEVGVPPYFEAVITRPCDLRCSRPDARYAAA